MSNQLSELQKSDLASDGISLSDLLARLHGSRRTLGMFALAGIAAAAIWLAGFQHLNPQHIVYSTAFRLDAKGGKSGSYPNGLEFTQHDIRSPSVLDAVHASSGVAALGISREELDAMISVVPYSPELESVRNRFIRMLGEKGLTPAERTQIEQDFGKALEEAGPEGIRVDLSSTGSQLTQSAAASILQSVLDNWSRIFVTDYGVANQPSAVRSKILIQEELIASEDFPIAFKRLEGASAELLARVSELTDLPGTDGIALAGRTINDNAREAREIDQFAIREILAPLAFGGLSREPEATSKRLAYSAQTVRDRIAEMVAQSRMIDELLSQTGTVSAQGQPLPAGAPGEANVTQLGDTAVDRLIGLVVSNADRPFIQDLLRQKQVLGSRQSSLATELSRIERLAAAAGQGGNTPDNNAGAQFSETANNAATDLNRLWSELNEFAEAASVKNLNPSRTLYSRIPLQEEISTTGGMRDPRGWGMALLLLVSAIASGIAVHLFRNASNQFGAPGRT
jgi:hypothetical protein